MNKTPIFPIPEPQHFSDYGFDHQISYFQVVEEARRHGNGGMETKPCLDSAHLKLQKPDMKESSRLKRNKHKLHQTRRAAATSAGKWLRSAGSALLFWKRNKKEHSHSRFYSRGPYSGSYPSCYSSSYSASGPLYVTESYSQEEPTTCRAKSGPLAGPYFNLRELNQTSGAQNGSGDARAMPVYIVT